MSADPSLNVRLYGTEEAPAAVQHLAAGPLSAVLDQGNLRYIALGGREAIRAIAFVLRDKNWATYTPEIADLQVQENADGFLVSYQATCRDAEQSLSYHARIEGTADGNVEFAVTATPETDWTTNRTGFVVLHGVEGIAGKPVTVTHKDGTVSETVFPDLISPGQPFFDIRSMTHAVAPGLNVTCTMEGDAYECEDQRNWTDASYKTYIRPLNKPRPYLMQEGAAQEQRVSLTVDGRPAAAPTGKAPVTVTLGDETLGTAPQIALAVTPEDAELALAVAPLVARAGPQALFCHFDPGRGHGVEDLRRFARLGEETGTSLVLEAVLPLKDAAGAFTDDPAVLDGDVARLVEAVEAAELRFDRISVSPLAYHSSYQPNEEWPSVPPLEAVYAETHGVFPHARLGGGMHSYFTELNRKRPPAHELNFITHTTCPIVHAADDVSVMESLDALPSIMKSTQAMAPGKPYWIGPSAIGMRFNPYGAAPMENPHNGRVAMARMDPRQRGLLNAAWVLGYAAMAARHGLEGACLAAPAGAFGIAYAKCAWNQPWFDEADGEGLVYPVYHVIRDLAAQAGWPVRDAASSAPGAVQALAANTGVGTRLWLANLTAEVQQVGVEGATDGPVQAAVLDADGFARLCFDANGFAETRPVDPTALALGLYAVARVHLD